ncbi:FlgO family outer membrane protein [Thalassomonas haliotis]|uniref:FlgO domain-containing protein n=1 Tax=Thalassomonas haliotis TaxID=485448 RepID=A0ABY7VHD8_9GAMM|nr:FlgO family outer membrane protein [Thalassomonas haliotis]WDE12087.1 hypothetical protein H3N35_00935 [Thalassomonas haliotis]
MNKFYTVLLVTCIGLMGCQTLDSVTPDSNEEMPATAIFDNKLSSLITGLLRSEKYDYRNKPTLITTFVWSDTLSYKSQPNAFKFLGHQLAESMKTELVQYSARVVEHKASKAVSISANASYFLSRDVKELASKAQAEYVIAGTITELDGGAMVNAEVIEISSSEIVGAAREFFPTTASWSSNQVSLRNNMLHREGK